MANVSFDAVEFQDYRILRAYSKELDVEVLAINVESIPEVPETFRNRIPEDRYRKMLRYHYYLDKMLLIGNEILFEYGMRQNFPEMESRQWIRQVDEAGKPYLEGTDLIYFNMSHAGIYSACAFSKKPVGLDIEQIKPIALSIAKRYYCRSEYEDIMEHSDEGRSRRFYQYWVLKESFIKAVGLGLSIPLNQFSFHDKAHSGLLHVEHNVNEGRYLSQEFSFCDSQYEMALCIKDS